MSFLEVIHYYHPECKDMNYLEVEDCRFLIIIDSFDGYLAPLDWEVSYCKISAVKTSQLSHMCYIFICCPQNAPVIKDSCTPAHLDVLMVNLIRGTLLPGGCVWILGRRAAVSQIPSQFLDVVTEIQGFRCLNYTFCLHTCSHGWYHLALLARIPRLQKKKGFFISKRNICTGLRWDDVNFSSEFLSSRSIFLLKSHHFTDWETLFIH